MVPFSPSRRRGPTTTPLVSTELTFLMAEYRLLPTVLALKDMLPMSSTRESPCTPRKSPMFLPPNPPTRLLPPPPTRPPLLPPTSPPLPLWPISPPLWPTSPPLLYTSPLLSPSITPLPYTTLPPPTTPPLPQPTSPPRSTDSAWSPLLPLSPRLLRRSPLRPLLRLPLRLLRSKLPDVDRQNRNSGRKARSSPLVCNTGYLDTIL